ncbi:MAG: hypothetical protein LC745_10455 [Planctomycetia bacterium]|nr:hypothetical protein [Planctomycetia bacterium]
MRYIPRGLMSREERERVWAHSNSPSLGYQVDSPNRVDPGVGVSIVWEISYNRAFRWVCSDFVVIRSGKARMSSSLLTPEQAESAERIYQTLRQGVESDLRALAELLASKPDRELLGPTEFEVRDRVHRIGAEAFETALDERKKARVAKFP